MKSDKHSQQDKGKRMLKRLPINDNNICFAVHKNSNFNIILVAKIGNFLRSMCSKTRKILDEGRMFNDEWFMKYFFVQQKERALGKIFRNNMACLKEINIKRHYDHRHSEQHERILGQLQVDEANQLKSLQGQQKMIPLCKIDSRLGTELSFKLSEAIAEKRKAFSCGEFVKHCLMTFAERACPEKSVIEQTSSSRFTVVRRIDALPSHLKMLWLTE